MITPFTVAVLIAALSFGGCDELSDSRSDDDAVLKPKPDDEDAPIEAEPNNAAEPWNLSEDPSLDDESERPDAGDADDAEDLPLSSADQDPPVGKYESPTRCCWKWGWKFCPCPCSDDFTCS